MSSLCASQDMLPVCEQNGVESLVCHIKGAQNLIPNRNKKTEEKREMEGELALSELPKSSD